MLNFINELQNKPENTRKKILYLSTTILMLVIVGVWATSMNIKLGSRDDVYDAEKSEEKVRFSSIRNSTVSFFQDFKTGLSEIKNAFTETKLEFERVEEIKLEGVSDTDAEAMVGVSDEESVVEVVEIE